MPGSETTDREQDPTCIIVTSKRKMKTKIEFFAQKCEACQSVVT